MGGHGFHLKGRCRLPALRACRLRPAVAEDLEVVLPWLASREELQVWGVSALAFPPERAGVWRAIRGEAGGNFVLVDAAGKVLGFGQAQPDGKGTVHLNRIIVAPGRRGQGVGRTLCMLLMARTAPARWTLKVFKENLRAAELFISLGFQECPTESSGNLLSMHCEHLPSGWSTRDRTPSRGAIPVGRGRGAGAGPGKSLRTFNMDDFDPQPT